MWGSQMTVESYSILHVRNSLRNLSWKKRLLIVAIAILMLGLPLFAVANSGLVQSSATQIQELFSRGSVAADQVQQAPVATGEGIAQLQCPTDLSVVDFVSGSHHAIALLSDGTAWGWGMASAGQLGVGSGPIAGEMYLSIPTQLVTPSGVQWDRIVGGGAHSFGIQSDGTLWAWGHNSNGQLGLGDSADRLVPTQVPGGATWIDVAGSAAFSIGIQSDGTLWTWGQNQLGQLGHGDTTNRNTPTQVTTPSGATWESVSASGDFAFGIQSNGTLWAWGRNGEAQLGLGDSADRLVPAQVANPNPSGATWVDVAGGGWHAVGLQSDGTLWTWGGFGPTGMSNTGKLGHGDGDYRLVPTQVTAPSATWESIGAGSRNSYAIQSDGTLWAWGQNTFGRLGLGDTDNRNIPTQVTTPSGPWVTATGGSQGTHFFAVHSDGSIWAAGNGQLGQIGIGVTENYSTLQLVMPLAPLAVSSVTPTGTNVAVENQSLVITFNQAVNITAGTRTVIFDGETLTGGTWSAGNTVLTFTLPTPLANSTEYEVEISGFQRADRGTVPNNCFNTHTHTFTTRGEAAGVPFVKTLRIPENTPIPTLNFTFEFSAVQVRLNPGENPPQYSVVAAEVPTITNRTIAITPASSNAPNAGVTYVTADLNPGLREILHGLLDGGPGGVYVWNVRELDTGTPNVTYDTTRFQIRAWVDRYGELQHIAIHALTEVEGVWQAGAKIDAGVNFVNTYRRMTTVSNHLFVSKTIPVIEANSMADRSTPFNFAVTITRTALCPENITFTARILDASNNQVGTDYTFASGTPQSIVLRDGQRLVFEPIALGTTFSVVEAAHSQFRASVTINCSVGTETLTNTDYNQERPTGNRIVGANQNSAEFSNNHRFVTPAGLVVTNTPFAFVGMAALVLLALFFARRQRRFIEELPVV